MRLWHIDLVPKLPRGQLLGQHRECCALRGNGWGKPHSTINYIFDYNPMILVCYHLDIIADMERRGYQVDPLWKNPVYRGKVALPWSPEELLPLKHAHRYPEHDQDYLTECLENLKEKQIFL